MQEFKIKINLDRSTSVKNTYLKIANKFENKNIFLLFEIPESLKNPKYFQYIFMIDPNGTTSISLANDYRFEISSLMTHKPGMWSMMFVLKESQGIEGEALNSEFVFISDPILALIDENDLDIAGIEETGMDPNLKTVYDKMFSLALDLQNKIDSDYWRGATGLTPNLKTGLIETGEPESKVSITITGTAEEPVLNMNVPRGKVGATPQISIGNVATVEPAVPASVKIGGTSEAPILKFEIPKGKTGNTPGIEVKVHALPEGAAPTVDKTGTSENAIFDFGIAKGDTGDITQEAQQALMEVEAAKQAVLQSEANSKTSENASNLAVQASQAAALASEKARDEARSIASKIEAPVFNEVITLNGASWQGNVAPFTYEIMNSQLTATSDPTFDFINVSMTSEQFNAILDAELSGTTIETQGKSVIVANGNKPKIDIQCRMEVKKWAR